MPAVKLCDGSSCRWRLFLFVQEVTQAVPAATSQIHRRHMRTRFFKELKVMLHGPFHTAVVQRRQKKCTKKRNAHVELLFCS